MEAVLSGDGPAHSTAWRGPGRGGADGRLTDSLSGSGIRSASVHARALGPRGVRGATRRSRRWGWGRRRPLVDEGAEDWRSPDTPLPPQPVPGLRNSQDSQSRILTPLPPHHHHHHLLLPISTSWRQKVHVSAGRSPQPPKSVSAPADPPGCQILCSAAVPWQRHTVAGWHAGSAAGGFRPTHHHTHTHTHTQVPCQHGEEVEPRVSFTDRCPSLPNGGRCLRTSHLFPLVLSKVRSALEFIHTHTLAVFLPPLPPPFFSSRIWQLLLFSLNSFCAPLLICIALTFTLSVCARGSDRGWHSDWLLKRRHCAFMSHTHIERVCVSVCVCSWCRGKPLARSLQSHHSGVHERRAGVIVSLFLPVTRLSPFPTALRWLNPGWHAAALMGRNCCVSQKCTHTHKCKSTCQCSMTDTHVVDSCRHNIHTHTARPSVCFLTRNKEISISVTKKIPFFLAMNWTILNDDAILIRLFISIWQDLVIFHILTMCCSIKSTDHIVIRVYTEVTLCRNCVSGCKASCSWQYSSTSIYRSPARLWHSGQHKTWHCHSSALKLLSLVPIFHRLTRVLCDGGTSLGTERRAPCSDRGILSIRRCVSACPLFEE